MTRYLILNADDFGHTMGVSQGVLRAHHEGIVTSTTVMVNRPAASEAIRQAQLDAPDLALGLHLNLTSGRPVLPGDTIPALVRDDGSFHRPDILVPMLATIDMDQIEQELRAQVDRFIQLAGAAPDHLDSHHHITYASPAIAVIMLNLASDLGVPVRNAFPTMAHAHGGVKLPSEEPNDTPHETIWTEMLARARVPMPRPLIDSFYDETATLGDLLNVLIDTPEGISEMMCHPAVPDDDLRAASLYADRRGDELAAILHPSVRELIVSQGIELITFKWLSSNAGVQL